MTTERKLHSIMNLIKEAQSDAAEAYNNNARHVTINGTSHNTFDAVVLMDVLLEAAEKIYNQPSGFVENTTGKNALT